MWCGGLLESLAGLRSYAQSRCFLDAEPLEATRTFFRSFLTRFCDGDRELDDHHRNVLQVLDSDAASTLRGLHSIRATKTKIMTQLVTLRFSNEFDVKIEASLNDFRKTVAEVLTSETLDEVFVALSTAFEVMVDNLVMEVIGLLRGARGFYASARTSLPTVAELEIECMFKRARMYARFGMQQQCRDAIAKLSERRPNSGSLDRIENFRAYLPPIWRLCGFERLAFREEVEIFRQSNGVISPWLKRRVEALINQPTYKTPVAAGVLPPSKTDRCDTHAGCQFNRYTIEQLHLARCQSATHRFDLNETLSIEGRHEPVIVAAA